MSDQPHPFGVDCGGSGIKGAPVDTATGEFAAERKRIETPQPATPQAVADVVAQLVDRPDVAPEAPIGVTVPGIVRHGVVRSAANIDHSWIGVDADALFTERLGRPVTVVNDADAAGYAEAVLGAEGGGQGVVIGTTRGAGDGSALIHDGVRGPNSEQG